MIDTTVGGYTITKFLAEGGMGTVWLARHGVMERDAVVKLLHPELGREPSIVERFINEARAAASINDPGIVQVFDVGHLPDQRPYIVMELLGGHTLAARLAQRHAEPPSRGRAVETVTVLRLIVRTLVAAHARGIVHRDLKPDNIFIVPDPDIAGGERTKIVDFGIAKLASGTATHKTRAGSMFGTPAYMAPEQCEDAASVDARADLYAVGCIGYEMLSGRPPFDGSGLAVIAAQLRDEPVPLRERDPAIPAELEAIVMRLLRKSPDERYAQTSELYAALDQLALEPARLLTPLPFPATTDQASTKPEKPEARAAAAAEAASRMTVAASKPLTTHGGASGELARTTAAPARARIAIGAGILLAVAAVVTFVVARPSGGNGTAARTDQVAVATAGSTERQPAQTSAQPTITQPTSAQPTAAQPTTAQPTAAQPTTAQPTIAQPTTVRPTLAPTPRPPIRKTPAPAPTTKPPAPAPTAPTLEPAPSPPAPDVPAPSPTPETAPPPPPLRPEPAPPAPVPAQAPAPTPTKKTRETRKAGPIWNNTDAGKKCPEVCKPMRWNGGWRTVKTGKMSTCDCVSD